MDFSKLVSGRYSVRKFLPQKVEQVKLDKILEAARVAPSAANKKPIKLIVVQQEEGLVKIRRATEHSFGAPLVIIACGDTKKAGRRPADDHPCVDTDTSIATDHMMLQAVDLGLGTCWIGDFDPQIIRHEFSIPEYLEPLNFLYVGYADGEPLTRENHEKIRVSIGSIVTYETL